jgi:hypothetical protein
MIKNPYRHNENGTTSIFATYLDEEKEIIISTNKFDKVSSINGKWRLWWDYNSRTYYVAHTDSDGNTVYLHRLIMDCPKGMQVHHLDGDGLNNRDSNLRVLTHKEHAQETKKKQREPIIGDPSLGVELHLLSEFAENGKRPFRLTINGFPFKSMPDDVEGHLMKWIANEIMNYNATDEEIYNFLLLRAGYKDKEMITKIIKWVRKYVRIPDPSSVKISTSKEKSTEGTAS